MLFVLSEAVKAGWIDRTACRAITPEYAATLPRSTLREGDVLVSKTGVYFGRSAVVTADLAGANTIAHVGVLRLKRRFDPYFVSTFLNCAYGYSQLRRRGIKATRPEIKLIEFADISIPTVSSSLAEAVRRTVFVAGRIRDDALSINEGAELLLQSSLGLGDWDTASPLAYERSSLDVYEGRRLDAEYFAPRVRSLIERLARHDLTVGGVAPPRYERFSAGNGGDFQYIEIGGVCADGTAWAETVPHAEAPSRAAWFVKGGDVITSTVRPIRRLSAVIAPEQSGFVCSSGFVVLRPRSIAPEVLLTYLRLPPICELMNLHTSASLYPAISEGDLLGLPIPRIEPHVQDAIVAAVQRAQTSRHRVALLLDAAKRAVEIAVEDSETAAVAWLSAAMEAR